MKLVNNTMTPVYLKTDPNMPFPTDKIFYLLTSDGLFLCRNHDWFQSCVPAKRGPGELAGQTEFVNVSYPLIPRMLIEKAIGFFHAIYKKHGWESALLIVWNKLTQQIELICPDQKASTGTVKYEIPNLPPHLVLVGDMHSHGSWSPNPSSMDEDDEMHRPGLHIVVGGITVEPPEFYCAAVVDGTRFKVTDIKALFEGYHQRDKNVPEEWLGKVKEYKYTYSYSGGSSHGYGGSYMDQDYDDWVKDRKKEDREAISEALAIFAKRDTCPTAKAVSAELFRVTKRATMIECDSKAEKFVKNWDRIKKGLSKHEEALTGKE